MDKDKLGELTRKIGELSEDKSVKDSIVIAPEVAERAKGKEIGANPLQESGPRCSHNHQDRQMANIRDGNYGND